MIEDFEDFPLPDWAERRADPHELEEMQQLFTLDGTKTGNATIVKILHNHRGDETSYQVVTDANSWMILTDGEVDELFSPGPFILKEFPNPKSYERDPE